MLLKILLVAVDVEVEILVGNLLVRAVRTHAGNRAIDTRLERSVVLAQADTRAVVTHLKRSSDKPESLASRCLQEAVIRFHRPQQRRVQPARHQVFKDAFLTLIRDHFHATRLPVLLCIRFELRAALYANALAAQTLRADRQRSAGLCDQT